MFSFKNEHIVITGRSRVIAQFLAAAFLQAEGRVSLWGRHSTTLKEAETELIKQGSISADNIHLESVDCAIKAAGFVTGVDVTVDGGFLTDGI